MEAESRHSNRYTALIAGLLAALGAATATGTPGCTTAPKAPEVQGPQPLPSAGAPSAEASAPAPSPLPWPGPFNPEAASIPAATPAATPAYGPEPIAIKPVVLVLGPGKARGFAHVGVIRALVQARIRIGAVLGTEMGGFVGSLYAMGGKVNQLEWALLKFKDDSFVSSGSSLLPTMFQKSARTKHFEADLKAVLGAKDLSQAAVPLRVATLFQDTGNVAVLERGSATEAVRAAMADPAQYEPGSWQGSKAVSAAQARPFLVTEARALGLGPVIVIDTMDEREQRTSAGAGELRDADLVIRPDLSGIGPMDFNKRNDAAFRGKKAIDAKMAEIRNLTGSAPQ